MIVSCSYSEELTMPVTVEWYTPEQTILHFQFIAPWNWTDYTQVDRQAREMMSAVQHKVDLILNFQKMGQLPGSSFSHLRRAATDPHPNQGIIVIVGMNVF